MVLVGYMRGHKIITTDGHTWKYADTGEECDDSRPCKRCGRYPTEKGHDACVCDMEGVRNACCGHGVKGKAYIQFEDGTVERGDYIKDGHIHKFEAKERD